MARFTTAQIEDVRRMLAQVGGDQQLELFATASISVQKKTTKPRKRVPLRGVQWELFEMG
jgi:hypothetical protein